ncbi:GATOR1 complex protein NPRL3-like isoform X2 [Symsagittifera roscoffensis]|uniref:GATOR1 complex protein NPRL3-like isoform X2 n=1 Tax=Symsagittifera roscoffensis TaxID=84072 RepID=UPI00307C315E
MSERDVIGLVLTLSGSRGNELLYRNPLYRQPFTNSPNDTIVSEQTNSQAKENQESLRTDKFTEFSAFDDALLENICVLKHNRSRSFHLEIDSVAFIGYPVQWDKTLMLHLVFATRANVSSKLTDQLSKLSQKAALMLLQEAEIMRDLSFDSIHFSEDTNRSNDESLFRSPVYSPSQPRSLTTLAENQSSPSAATSPPRVLLKQQSYLGSKQRKCRRLVDFLNFLTCVEVGTSLCLTLPSGAPFSCHIHANPQKVQAEIDRIQPYHTILLSPDIVQDTSGEFPPDFSTAICALISAVCCSKPLYQIAADADLTLRHAMKIAAHLVYWDRAKVAYPICQSRVYILTLSSNGLLYVKSTIARDLKAANSLAASELFETFLSFCGSSGGQFELGVLFERLCLISPDLQWAHLRQFVNSLLWCQYITEVHNYPLYKSYFVHNSNENEANSNQRQQLRFESISDENEEAPSRDILQSLGIRSILQDMNGTVHLDALAYKLNRSIVSLLGELKPLEQSNQILSCYRIEDW